MRTPTSLATKLLVVSLSAVLLPPVGAQDGSPIHPAAALESESCRIVLVSPSGQADRNQAIARWQALVREGTNVVAYLERLGWAYVAQARATLDPGYYTLAGKTAECMDRVGMETPAALLLRGHVLHNQHQFAAAEKVARKLVVRRGLSYDYGLLGDVALEQGELGAARAAYERMMALRPGPEAYARAAQLRWLHGDLQGAIQVLELALRAADARTPEAAAWYTVQLGRYVWQSGEFDRARALAERALALRPDYAPALLLQGHLLLGHNRPQEALDPLQRAVQAVPLPEYRWALAECLRVLGRGPEAANAERELIARGAVEDPRTLSLFLATTTGDAATALALARRELAKRRDARTLDAMAWALFAAGETEAARRHLSAALAHGIVDPRLHFHAVAMAESDTEARAWLNRIGAQAALLLPSERARLAALGKAMGVAITPAASGNSVAGTVARHRPR